MPYSPPKACTTPPTGSHSSIPPKSYSTTTFGEQFPVNIDFLSSIVQTFGANATDHPLQILGDTVSGAVVYSVDTPGLFGAEIGIISAIDFLGGKITHEVDYWDGRKNPVATAGRVSPDMYPVGLRRTLLRRRQHPS